MTDVELFLLYYNAKNLLTANKWASARFKDVINKMCLKILFNIEV